MLARGRTCRVIHAAQRVFKTSTEFGTGVLRAESTEAGYVKDLPFCLLLWSLLGGNATSPLITCNDDDTVAVACAGGSSDE